MSLERVTSFHLHFLVKMRNAQKSNIFPKGDKYQEKQTFVQQNCLVEDLTPRGIILPPNAAFHQTASCSPTPAEAMPVAQPGSTSYSIPTLT